MEAAPRGPAWPVFGAIWLSESVCSLAASCHGFFCLAPFVSLHYQCRVVTNPYWSFSTLGMQGCEKGGSCNLFGFFQKKNFGSCNLFELFQKKNFLGFPFRFSTAPTFAAWRSCPCGVQNAEDYYTATSESLIDWSHHQQGGSMQITEKFATRSLLLDSTPYYNNSESSSSSTNQGKRGVLTQTRVSCSSSVKNTPTNTVIHNADSAHVSMLCASNSIYVRDARY